MVDLPEVVPLFPLPNVVLFPDASLPLHVFEPRYREMVRDAEAAQRMIGMVLLRGNWREDYYGAPEVFRHGCAGQLTTLEALPDGRYNILLRGVREFVIEGEIRDRPYRQARVRWLDAPSGSLDTALRRRVRTLVWRLVQREDSTSLRALLDDARIPDPALIHLLCHAVPLAALEKQALLEAPPLTRRAECLCELLELALRATFWGSDAPSERCH